MTAKQTDASRANAGRETAEERTPPHTVRNEGAPSPEAARLALQRASRTLNTIADLQPGDHLCCLYETEEEHRAVVVPFLRLGLERGEKVVYIVDAHTAETILDYLRNDGLDVRSHRTRGQLAIREREDTYLRAGVFDPVGMIATLRTETERALAEGYTALRVTGEMTWALRGRPGSERLVEYENRLNEFFPGSRCLAMCQYDRRRFDPVVLLDMLRTHPCVVIGTEICDNPYYLPTADFQSADRPASDLRQWTFNLTERKRATAALRENEERYRRITEGLTDYQYTVRVEQGRAVETTHSPACARVTGYTAAEFAADPYLWIRMVAPEDRELVRERAHQILAGMEIPPIEHRLVRKDGETRWVCDTIIPLKDAAGNLRSYDGVIQDITELKRMAAEKDKLEVQNRQLQKAESLGRMAGAIAHHFNNLLGAVMVNLDLAMRDRPPHEEANENLTDAMLAARKAAEVSNLMLTYLGFTHGKRQPLDLSEACRRSLFLLRAAVPKGVALESDLPSPGPVISADANQIQQVLTNLITNAWEAMADARGTIRLTLETVTAAEIPAGGRFPPDWQPRERAYVRLEVADTGIGMAAPDIERSFDPFFTTKFIGRGLGLPVVLGLVRAHDGVVTVASTPGRGSVFRVFFPASVEALPRKPDKDALEPKFKGNGTMLLVEDEPVLRKAVATALRGLGFTVLAAADGVEAVELFRRRRDEIRFVLCDLSMPRMNGWETLTALRQLAPDLPVILSSGYDEAQVSAGDHPERPQAFLSKPYEHEELIHAIRQALKA